VVKNRRVTFASVAELADAQGLGPCVLRDLEVRLLSLALIYLCLYDIVA
jgi:hypothetical protein